MIVVVDYDPEWERAFQELRRQIGAALGELAITIEHVGSTAVPGLAAKPVIDMDVVVAEPDLAEAIKRLGMLGYEHMGDMGIPGREAFRPPPGSRSHHLYVCPADSPALANHLALRDHLRSSKQASREYGELKKRLAGRFGDDIDGYVEGKTTFIVGILAREGISGSALADIEEMNRKPDAGT